MTMSYEERIMVLRDKAADIGVELPVDVADYLAGRSDSANDLKSSLINVASFATQRKRPISLELAKFYLDGVRPEGGIEALPTKVESQRILGAEEEENEEETSAATLELPLVTPGPPPAAFMNFQSEDPITSVMEEGVIPPDLAEPPEFDYEPYSNEPTYEEEAIYEEPYADFDRVEPELISAPAAVPLWAPEPEPEPLAAVVQFAPIRSERKRSMLERITLALKRAGIEEVIKPGDKVAIKVHFGEAGNTAFVSSIYTREVVRLVKELGGKPFVTDANTLYSGMRANAIDHIQCALENGFSYATIGAPIIIADGLNGHEATEIRINGKHFDTVKLGSAAIEADAMIVISHVKGHEMAGFGGALKNVGMGLGCRSAKQRMHSGVKPHVVAEKCINCGKCINWCGSHCISTRVGADGKRASWIDQGCCVGCGECVAACAYGAIEVNWETDAGEFLERLVEHAAGALQGKDGKMAYLSFITDVSPECDCFAMSDAAIVSDIGVLAARDIVAIDQAAYDLVCQATGLPGSRGEGLASGEDKFQAVTGTDGAHAMIYAEGMGLGSRHYELKTIA
jgi:uncharacterized Fe-S center protein